MTLPNHGDGGLTERTLDKLVVVLRTPLNEAESYVPVVIASTHQRTSPTVYQHEVSFDPEVGKFTVPTLADCRWVFSVSSARFHAGSYRFSLTDQQSTAVSEAVAVGLQLY